ncbi:MAG: lipid-A-disaccharide synthase [Deltaproteobacteria bacterium]|jgi:lipid-A-disaccharide synthase|nr:lipid-A-disaccharide synthase [Deltaproteobacteria bacterium]
MQGADRRVMISAGEESGDLHGAALIREAAARGLPVSFFGLGGDRMRDAGCRLLAHARETAVMGIAEVLGQARRLLRLREEIARVAASERPDALVLIDSPDFNFRLAKRATEAGIPVVYYICPQIWAWRQGRIRFLAKYARRRLVILPFEEEFYRARGVTADFVGHPLLDETSPVPRAEAREALPIPQDGDLLAVLPGSRRGVFARLAPVMLEAAAILSRSRPGLRVAVALAPTLPEELAERHLAAAPPALEGRLHPLRGLSQTALNAASAALIASGTSAAEAAVLGTPAVVCYRTSPVSYLIARLLVKTPHISIPNLVLGRRLLPELVQGDATPARIAAAAAPFLDGGPELEEMSAGLREVTRALGGPGASARALDIVLREAGGQPG